ncbi:hypothetical protein A6J33_000465 [Pantoea sp. FDAARGOS_194]|uniref:Uncharacterized protein n=1 Tax=Pantoea septica TaxID=472695 RepID=A0ABX3URW2_9GAMM|nr:hypothetical protein HA46_10555 [Pantoea septica]PNK70727.1 hypothetical protein A6J33_000465 [Pantoea sp. FDAARGOS_194]
MYCRITVIAFEQTIEILLLIILFMRTALMRQFYLASRAKRLQAFNLLICMKGDRFISFWR